MLDLYIAASLRETAEGLQSDGFGELEDWREDLFVLYQVRSMCTLPTDQSLRGPDASAASLCNASCLDRSQYLISG